jgi:hypothetical protein
MESQKLPKLMPFQNAFYKLWIENKRQIVLRSGRSCGTDYCMNYIKDQFAQRSFVVMDEFASMNTATFKSLIDSASPVCRELA